MGGCVGMCLLLKDIRMVYIIITFAITAPTTVFFYSLPSGMRRRNQILVLGCLIAFGIFQVALYYNWMKVECVEYNLGAIKLTASGYAATSITNVMIYYFKNMINAILHPESMVMIKSAGISFLLIISFISY